jgi:hypothetical protein
MFIVQILRHLKSEIYRADLPISMSFPLRSNWGFAVSDRYYEMVLQTSLPLLDLEMSCIAGTVLNYLEQLYKPADWLCEKSTA